MAVDSGKGTYVTNMIFTCWFFFRVCAWQLYQEFSSLSFHSGENFFSHFLRRWEDFPRKKFQGMELYLINFPIFKIPKISNELPLKILIVTSKHTHTFSLNVIDMTVISWHKKISCCLSLNKIKEFIGWKFCWNASIHA